MTTKKTKNESPDNNNKALEIWNALKTPPASALKEIVGGRLKGMTDIRPQWRYEAMTRQFGLCGIGWRYEIVNKWTELGEGGQVVAFVDVNLYVKVDGEWSAAIPGTGGSLLTAKERGGLYTSDEAYKMATTDALGTAMKMIGVAADIYMGEKTKYDNAKDDNPPARTTQRPVRTITQKQLTALHALAGQKGMSHEDIKKAAAARGFHGSGKDMPITVFDQLYKALNALPDQAKEEYFPSPGSPEEDKELDEMFAKARMREEEQV